MMKKNKITQRYYQLLEREKQLVNEGISHRERWLLPEMKELTKYEIALLKGKRYENRNLYLDCIEKFRTGTINGDEMTGIFMMLRDSDMERKLTSITDENFNESAEIDSFSHLVSELYLVCEAFDEEATTYDECDETWLHETVSLLFNEWKERNSKIL
jgi:hypothetical protein